MNGNSDKLVPYIYTASMLICQRIGQPPSVYAVYEFVYKLLQRLDLDADDVPTVMYATLELWYRMTHHSTLRVDVWKLAICVVLNLAGKLLVDDWYSDSNGVLCALVDMNLQTFNTCEASVCAHLDYNLSLSSSGCAAFEVIVQDAVLETSLAQPFTQLPVQSLPSSLNQASHPPSHPDPALECRLTAT